MNISSRRTTYLRRAREAAGLSQERTAVAAGISLAWLRLVERDPSLMSARVARQLLPVLGLEQPKGAAR